MLKKGGSLKNGLIKKVRREFRRIGKIKIRSALMVNPHIFYAKIHNYP
jgi:hypothetical protein